MILLLALYAAYVLIVGGTAVAVTAVSHRRRKR